MTPSILFADFETEGIERRPDYPPKPVGISLWPVGGSTPWRAPRYFAFGHPTENNSTEKQAITAYRSLARNYITCWHHAAFDLEVAEAHWGCAWPSEWHDTLLLAFLVDPRFRSFSLKPLAHEVLGMPPGERDELKEWIIANVPEAKKKKSTWGKYICRAPGGIVGTYANGDTRRSKELFIKFWRDVNADQRLRAAYDRERSLTPRLITMEKRGVPVRTQLLARDLPIVQKRQNDVERWILDRLRVPKREREEFVFTGDCLADALERAKKVKEWILTKNDNRATNAEDLREVCLDPKLVDELEVRSQIATCINTFMTPWLESGREHDGLFYARFNQVRQQGGGEGNKQVGAVTGRISMTPNLQNVIRADKDERVPRLRDYIWSGERGLYLGQRDYSQQELRITAHYEGGPFLQMYLKQPDIDAHNAVGELIYRTADVRLERRDVKDLNFGLLYGMGAPKLARKLKIAPDEAKKLSRLHLKALPGIRELRETLTEAANKKEPLWTWGGRRYYCEEPVMREGRRWSFEYKQLNVLIQGSAADVTKQAMVNYFDAGHDDKWPLLLQVHDELLFTAPAKQIDRAHRALRESMLDVKMLGAGFKVPMLSDGKVGSVSWHRMKKVSY